jgi:hypothetical protein
MVFVSTPQKTVRTDFIARVEKTRRELDRLQDGWCGPDSRAPSSGVLADFDRILTAIPTGALSPEVEVDDETGNLTLRWSSTDRAVGFSFVLRGDRRALAVKTVLGDGPIVTSKTFDLVDGQAAIERYLATDENVAGAITPE